VLIQLVYFLAVNKVNVVSDAFIPGKDLYAIHKDTPALLILGLFIIEGHIVVEPEIRMLVWDIVRIQSAFENSFLLLFNRELCYVLVGVLEFGEVLEHLGNVFGVKWPF
jgi:hypothetical protein